jgi:hypothetical protein
MCLINGYQQLTSTAVDSFDVYAVLANGGAMASLRKWFGMW